MGVNPQATGEQSAPVFPYVFRWKTHGRKGQRCRILRKVQGNCQLEFEDGHLLVISVNSVLRSPEHKNSILTDRLEPVK